MGGMCGGEGEISCGDASDSGTDEATLVSEEGESVVERSTIEREKV